MDDEYPVSDAEYRDRLLVPVRDEVLGRRIVDVRFVSDDEVVRSAPEGDDVSLGPGDQDALETDEVKLCLDNGSEIRLDLMSFSVRGGGSHSLSAPLGEAAPQPKPSPTSAHPTYERLMVLTAQDGSEFVMGFQFASPDHPLRLVFHDVSRGGPEPLPPGDLQVRYVTLGDDQKCIVLLGDDCDDPRVERVVLSTPYEVGRICRLLKPRHYRRVWMSPPEPFKPGPVTAWWMRGDEILHKAETPPLEWGTAYPPIPTWDATYAADSEE